eukprot:scaffold121664_cov56-Cyclotella_meneghiniana.AAC.1
MDDGCAECGHHQSSEIRVLLMKIEKNSTWRHFWRKSLGPAPARGRHSVLGRYNNLLLNSRKWV